MGVQFLIDILVKLFVEQKQTIGCLFITNGYLE